MSGKENGKRGLGISMLEGPLLESQTEEAEPLSAAASHSSVTRSSSSDSAAAAAAAAEAAATTSFAAETAIRGYLKGVNEANRRLSSAPPASSRRASASTAGSSVEPPAARLKQGQAAAARPFRMRSASVSVAHALAAQRVPGAAGAGSGLLEGSAAASQLAATGEIPIVKVYLSFTPMNNAGSKVPPISQC
jgi:hypothetical protein